MPLIKYVCGCKNHISKLFKSRDVSPDTIPCLKCGAPMGRHLSGPSLSSTVTVDNGVQSRAVEVNLEVVESNKENTKKDFREK